MVELSVLEELVTYDPETGEVRWRERPPEHFYSAGICASWNERYAGRVISAKTKKGYPIVPAVRPLTRKVRQHHVAWLFTYGALPAGEIDHINCDKTDNRISNLRAVTPLQNSRNKRGGLKPLGVAWNRRDKSWVVRISRGPGLPEFSKYEICFGKAVRMSREAYADLGYDPNHGRVAEGANR